AHGLDTRSEKERDEILLDLALAAIRAHPGMFVRGVVHEYSRYFHNYQVPLASRRVFSAIAGLSGPATEPLCSVFFVAGVMFCAVWRRWRMLSLLIACWLGIALSVPMLAEMERRLFAVTVPATALLGAAGLGFIVRPVSGPDYKES